MSSWLERKAGEWLAGEAEPGRTAPRAAQVAAYAGALGAAMVLSACRRTLRERGAAAPLEASCSELQALLDRLGADVERTQSEGREDVEAILDTFDACFGVLDVAEREVGSLRAEDVSDLWTGAELAAASLEAQAIHVRIGLSRITDEAYGRPVKGGMIRSLHEARRVRDRILQVVEGRLVL